MRIFSVSSKVLKKCLQVLLVALTVGGAAIMAQAQVWPGAGTLSNTETIVSEMPYVANYSNWTWTDASNVPHVFPGVSSVRGKYIYYIDQEPRLTGYAYTSLNVVSTDGTYTLTAKGDTGTISVSGTCTTPYIVLGVIYAPPGNGSFVQFNTSQALGYVHNTKDTWSRAIAASATLDVGVLVANTNLTITQGWTSSSTNSITTGLTTTTGSDSKWTGHQDGINHDNDVLIVWLNPKLRQTATNLEDITKFSVHTSFESNTEFGQAEIDSGNPVDIREMDLVYTTVGELRAEIANPGSMNPNGNGLAFKRTWCSDPSPALKTADFQTILAYDPFWDPNHSPTVASLGKRYSAVPVASVPYVPYNINTGYDNSIWSRSQTSTRGESNSFGVTWALNAGVKTFFASGTKVSDTFTWSHEYSDTQTQTQTHQTTFSITGPQSAWNGPNRIHVYRDQACGTYLFVYGME
jgi:hypothetical protein